MTKKKKHAVPHASLTISAELDQLSTARKFVRSVLSKIPEEPLAEERLDMIELATNELVVNIIRHAYDGASGNEVLMEIDYEGNCVDLRFYDWGKAWDPQNVPPPEFDGSREGGFGLYIISQAVDEVCYTRDSKGRNCSHFRIAIKEEK